MTHLKNDKGLTLVEILATIVILSIVVLFISSILQSTTKQNEVQQAAARELNDATFILKNVTKDFRRSYKFKIQEDFNILELFQPNDITVTYEVEGTDIKNLIKKRKSTDGAIDETETVAENIVCFKLTEEGSDKLKIKISTNPEVDNCEAANKELKQTTLQIRRGDT